jgi:transcription elongation factor Elf1
MAAANNNRAEISCDLAPCPFCASSEVEFHMVLKARHSERVFVCGNCHVEIRPPAWHCATDADAVNFWNRCLRPAAPRD